MGCIASVIRLFVYLLRKIRKQLIAEDIVQVHLKFRPDLSMLCCCALLLLTAPIPQGLEEDRHIGVVDSDGCLAYGLPLRDINALIVRATGLIKNNHLA